MTRLDIIDRLSAKPFTVCGKIVVLYAYSRNFFRRNFGGAFAKGIKVFSPFLVCTHLTEWRLRTSVAWSNNQAIREVFSDRRIVPSWRFIGGAFIPFDIDCRVELVGERPLEFGTGSLRVEAQERSLLQSSIRGLALYM